MIKFSPVRRTMSESLKEEKVFCSVYELENYVLDRYNKAAMFIGHNPVSLSDLVITDPSGDDVSIGYKNVRSVFIGSLKIGFCGE